MCAYLRESTDSLVQEIKNEVNLSFKENSVTVIIEPLNEDAAELSEKTAPDIFLGREIKKELVDDAELQAAKCEFKFDVEYKVKQERVDQQTGNGELNDIRSIKEEPEGNAETIRQSITVFNVETIKVKQEKVECSVEENKLGTITNVYDEQKQLGKKLEPVLFHSATERDTEEVEPGHIIEITITPELSHYTGAETDPLSSDTDITLVASASNRRCTASKAERVGAARKYQCTLCDTQCSIRSDLTIHMRIHTGEKPYSCDICKRAFRRKQHLQVHILSHIGNKPYHCEICNKNFTHNGSLTQHKRIHNNYKPHSCTICDKKFTRSGHLTQHMTTHTDYKPHICNICDKKFTRSGHLIQHLRIHNNDKPYCCEICFMKFNQSGHLTRHMRVHTGDKPYHCDTCDKKFAQKSHLTHHTRLVHK